MSELLEFLRTHEEAFRSRARLASLYSDFRTQRHTNPDGYQANASAWLHALSDAAKEGLVPNQSGQFVLQTGEELLRTLQTQEFGRPLALGAAVEDAVRKKELVPLRAFLDIQISVYTQSWLPSPWQAVNWGLRQLGLVNEDVEEDRLVAGNFVVMANVEAAANAVLSQAWMAGNTNTSRIFSRDLFAASFASAIGADSISSTDASILLTHLSRDKAAVAYSPSTGTMKFKAPSESQPSPISAEDISIASLRTLIATLEPQVEDLTNRINELDVKARDAVAKKQLTTAKSALRSKKMIETKLQQRAATLIQLEEVYGKIEQAADQVEMMKVMEASSQTLKSLNAQTGGVEKVQEVSEGMRDEMMTVDEIGNALNEASAGAVDEGEVDDELEALEKVERQKQEEQERDEKDRQQEVERKKRELVGDQQAEETKKRLAELDHTKSPQREAEVKKTAEEEMTST